MPTPTPASKTEIQELKAAIAEYQEQWGKEALKFLLQSLLTIVKDPILKTTFNTFINTLKASISLQKTELNLVLLELTAALSLAQTSLNSVEALVKSVTSLKGRFPIDKLPKSVSKRIQKLLNPVTSHLPKAVTSIQTYLAKYQEFKQEVYQLQQQVARINVQIQEFTYLEEQLDGIQKLFNALLNYPAELINEIMA